MSTISIENDWRDVDKYTPEIARKEGSVLAVKVLYEDGTEDVLGWSGKDYYIYDGKAKPITHFKFI